MSSPNLTGWVAPSGRFHSIGGAVTDHDDIARELVHAQKVMTDNPRGWVERPGYIYFNIGNIRLTEARNLTYGQRYFIAEQYRECKDELPEDIRNAIKGIIKNKAPEFFPPRDPGLAACLASKTQRGQDAIRNWRYEMCPGG